ncbi:MAG: gamma-glutamyltransferase, partial [Chitinophagales bacterium]
KTRMSDFNAEKATLSSTVKAGTPAPKETEQTTHFSIVDAEGNAVSITTTLNGGYGSKVVVGGAGFLLNNEMDDFSAKPGVPNMFGLIGAEANAIEPGKRMLSSMTPTIVERGDSLFMVVGTPGGSTIITSVFQTILNVVEHKRSMQEAVNAARFHHQWRPDTIFVEAKTLTPTVKQELEKMGHTIMERGNIGRVDAILVRTDGKLEGGADIRGDDTALGY